MIHRNSDCNHQGLCLLETRQTDVGILFIDVYSVGRRRLPELADCDLEGTLRWITHAFFCRLKVRC